MDENHIHFLVQSVPTYSAKEVVQTIKKHKAIEIFNHHQEVKEKLWGDKFWTSGYYVNTIGQYGNASVIKKYVENQGKEYKKLYSTQLKHF